MCPEHRGRALALGPPLRQRQRLCRRNKGFLLQRRILRVSPSDHQLLPRTHGNDHRQDLPFLGLMLLMRRHRRKTALELHLGRRLVLRRGVPLFDLLLVLGLLAHMRRGPPRHAVALKVRLARQISLGSRCRDHQNPKTKVPRSDHAEDPRGQLASLRTLDPKVPALIGTLERCHRATTHITAAPQHKRL